MSDHHPLWIKKKVALLSLSGRLGDPALPVRTHDFLEFADSDVPL